MGRVFPQELRDRVVGSPPPNPRTVTGQLSETRRPVRTLERAQRQRSEFLDEVAERAQRRFIFLDEAGSTISMTRDHGWAPSGKRLVDHVPRNRGTVLTMIGALTARGLEAMMTNVGGTSGDVFETFIREHLVPILAPGDVVVLDNLGAHHRKTNLALIEEAGAEPLFMPPYSPELNPIELCWSS